MDCHLGQHDAHELVVLPRSSKIKDDQYLACIPCAEKVGLWCVKHQSPHTGFVDGTTACLLCVDELARQRVSEAEQFLSFVASVFAPAERRPLDEWLEVVTELTGQSRAMCLSRAVASRACRLGPPATVSDQYSWLKRDRDFSRILPNLIPV